MNEVGGGYELVLKDQQHSWLSGGPQPLLAKTKPEQEILFFFLNPLKGCRQVVICRDKDVRGGSWPNGASVWRGGCKRL